MVQQQQHQHVMSMNPYMMSISQINPNQHQQSQAQMLTINRNYGMWAPPQPQPPNPNIGAVNPPPSAFNKASNLLGPRSNWKGKRINKLGDKRRKEPHNSLIFGSCGSGSAGGVNMAYGVDANMNFNNYNLPTLNELQYQNRLKTRKFFSNKKFNKNNSLNINMACNNNSNWKAAPFAPRNTTSFLIRAKKSGGIASLVSPYPVTPAVLPTPIFSPSREVLVDMAKEEWGVDGYGSMKGLIRLKSPGHEIVVHEVEEEDDAGSSESDVEEHVEVERRLDHDLSRFEMIYDPNSLNVGGIDYHSVLENRVDDEDTHIAQLEEENMILKERLLLMEREIGELTRSLQCLERRRNRMDDDEEIVDNESDNGSVSNEYAPSSEENNNEFGEENVNKNCFKEKEGDNDADFDEKVENDSVACKKVENDDIIDAECKVGDNGNADFDEKVANGITPNAEYKVLKDSNELVQNKNIVLGEEREQNKECLGKFANEEVEAGDNANIELSECRMVDEDGSVEHIGVTKVGVFVHGY